MSKSKALCGRGTLVSAVASRAATKGSVSADVPELTTSRTMRPGPEEANPVRFRQRRRRVELALAWVAPIIFVLSWELASRASVVNPTYFPAPSTVWGTAVDLLREDTIQHHLWISLKRVLTGFALGVISGTLVGIVMGLSRKVQAALDGLLTALYMVPKLAILPLLLLIFGLGETPKIFMIAITIFFFMWLTTMAAFVSLPAGYDEAARSFGASRIQRLRHVDFPAALPAIFVGLRLNIGVAMLVVVSVEFVSSSDGIGWLIWNSWTLLAAAQMYAGIIAVSITGVVLTLIVRFIGKAVLPWTRSTSGDAPAPF